MKKMFYLMFYLMLFAGCFSVSDTGEEDLGQSGNPKEVMLELSVSDLVFKAEGSEKEFMIFCNGDWIIENECDWCKVNVNFGQGNQRIVVEADVYNGMEDRNTNLTVKASDKTQVLGVTQKYKDAILLSKDKYEVSQEGESISIKVKSNVSYEVTIPSEFQSWIVQIPDVRSLSTKSYDFMISANDSTDERMGYVVFSGNSVIDTVYVYQAKKDVLILTEDSYELSTEGGNIVVELRTNIDYEVYIPDTVLWIRSIETRGLRTDKLLFLVEKNEGVYNRNAVIIIHAKNRVLSDTLYINQHAKRTDLGGCFDIDIALLMKSGLTLDTDSDNKIDGWYYRGTEIVLQAVLSSIEGYIIENGHYKWTIDGLELPEEHFELETDTCVLTWIPEFQEDDIVVKVCGYSDGACEEVCSRYLRLKAYDLTEKPQIVRNSMNPRNIAPYRDVYFAITTNGTEPLVYQWYRNVNGGWVELCDKYSTYPQISGSMTDSLVLRNVPEDWDDSQLKVVVTNNYGMVSKVFQLGVK